MTDAAQPAVARSRADLASLLTALRSRPGPVVLVPTMGALHEGHATLMRAARRRAGADGSVVVSIFVNPLQFGPDEDLDRYPRTLEADLELTAAEGVDLVFAPSVEEMYPDGVPHPGSASNAVTVDPGPIAGRLEGASRPGHFRGVLTVVAKLFGLVRPDAAVFGEKDFQQLALIRRMAEDLCLGVEVLGAPTDREGDGLARSSRNRYLDDEPRRAAVALSRALFAARAAGAADGLAAALAAGREELARTEGVEVDYFTVLGPGLDELDADPAPGAPARALVAARVGTTRLIDNLDLVLREPAGATARSENTDEGVS
ncbi:pantoate--beta-alanine ligase [Nocardioides sp. zg-ZUI104]|uniref:pantoate--beta-alanine ligase n=1 Tax=Nocardioides faecalis TaxID=2803858 RepID=UPI001BCFCA03|nr:pantoate--beta-alanine ligase [Nocardioides faecalis]MBS4752041.1 pantoate--beta-alanine ligase [Nocardioides faecalis]